MTPWLRSDGVLPAPNMVVLGPGRAWRGNLVGAPRTSHARYPSVPVPLTDVPAQSEWRMKEHDAVHELDAFTVQHAGPGSGP